MASVRMSGLAVFGRIPLGLPGKPFQLAEDNLSIGRNIRGMAT